MDVKFVSAVIEGLLAVYFGSIPMGLLAVVLAIGSAADAVRERRRP